MPNYERGKIYKLVCKTEGCDEVYVGGTVLKLNKRMCTHRFDAKWRKSKVYKYMRQHGIENFVIELLETYPCGSRKELDVREQFWIDQLQASLNAQSAARHPDADKIYNDKPENKARTKEWSSKQRKTCHTK